MSATAMFYIIQTNSVQKIISSIKSRKTVDDFYEALTQNIVKEDVYPQGYDLAVLSAFLDEQKIPIAKNDYMNLSKLIIDELKLSALMFDAKDKKIFEENKEKIDSFQDEEISAFYTELFGMDDPDSGARIKELVSQISDLLNEIDDDKVILVMIA